MANRFKSSISTIVLQQQDQLKKLKEDLTDEISFHEEQIKRHQDAINRHKQRVSDMDAKP